MIHHGALTSRNGFVYSAGAALLGLDQPWKMISHTAPYLISPQMLCKCIGDAPNVVFLCATRADAMIGGSALYYGATDTMTRQALCEVDELIDFVKTNSILRKRNRSHAYPIPDRLMAIPQSRNR